MNKKERVDAALRGDQVDRIPASMWGHDFEREWSAQTLAEAMVENFTRYDWDYMKVNPRASYHVEGWGVKVRPSGEKYKSPIFEGTPIKSASDWKRLRPLEPDRGVLGEQLRALQLINHAVGFNAYFVQTIFCPLRNSTPLSVLLQRNEFERIDLLYFERLYLTQTDNQPAITSRNSTSKSASAAI